jgi:ubiquinone/menaquinone biosynthesis C-methylase UbiE
MEGSMALKPAMKPYKGMGMNGVIAKWYASQRSKSMDEFRALARRVADEVPLGGHVLEVAPGPGYFSIELAKLGRCHVTGLDISPTFVEMAARNARDAGVPVTFQQGNASAMPFPSESFDFVLCSAAFKNFTDPVGAMEEMYRVLRKGGRALIIDLRGDAPQDAIENAVEHMHLGAVNTFVNKLIFRFMLLKRAYTRRQLEDFAARTRFQSVEIKPFEISYEITLERRA